MTASRGFHESPDGIGHLSSSQSSKPGNPARFIVVEGPIGVGKTSLAIKLAESLSAELLLEEVYENPFLERFYREQYRTVN